MNCIICGKARSHRNQKFCSKPCYGIWQILYGTSNVERFERSLGQVGDCLVWTGHKDSSGYGQFMMKDEQGNWKTKKAHRFYYAVKVAQIPEHLQLDHLCRNRACVNPGHLEAVTCQENIRRGLTGIVNRSKPSCPAGHPYDELNTYHIPSGGRGCKICRRNQLRTSRQNQKNTIKPLSL